MVGWFGSGGVRLGSMRLTKQAGISSRSGEESNLFEVARGTMPSASLPAHYIELAQQTTRTTSLKT